MRWLTGKNEKGEPNNPLYQDVTIDVNRFVSLPEDDYLIMPLNANFKNYDEKMSEDEDGNDNDDEILRDIGHNSEENEDKVYDSNTEMGTTFVFKQIYRTTNCNKKF